jgi:hypothetical protein
MTVPTSEELLQLLKEPYLTVQHALLARGYVQNLIDDTHDDYHIPTIDGHKLSMYLDTDGYVKEIICTVNGKIRNCISNL